MTKEELKQEAEEYAKKVEPCLWAEEIGTCVWRYKDLVNAYLASAEPREKRIAELEQENKVLTQNLEDTEIVNKALEKENAELKEINTHTLSQLNLDNGELMTQLTKAKEIIKELLCLFPDFQAKSLGDLHILNTLAKAEAFLNSEVEE